MIILLSILVFLIFTAWMYDRKIIFEIIEEQEEIIRHYEELILKLEGEK